MSQCALQSVEDFFGLHISLLVLLHGFIAIEITLMKLLFYVDEHRLQKARWLRRRGDYRSFVSLQTILSFKSVLKTLLFNLAFYFYFM
jgi:hypothetical protein